MEAMCISGQAVAQEVVAEEDPAARLLVQVEVEVAAQQAVAARISGV